ERIEGALAERELAAAAGQDVQRQNGDAVDQNRRQLEDDEVLHEQRHHKQDQQYGNRSARAERHGSLGNGIDGGSVGDGFLDCAHDQTRLMTVWPNRPEGLTTRTMTISASAMGSFSSLPA